MTPDAAAGPAPAVSAYADDALGHLDAVGVALAIRAGEVSRAEVRAAAVARCSAVDPLLNAVAHEGYDPLPPPAPPRGPGSRGQAFFDGVPTFVKDMVQAAGFPETQGSDAWRASPASADGDFVRRFRELGVDVLGVTRMSEFGLNPVAEHPRLGPVRNPWDTTLTAGGSSSGAGALVASGAVPLAHAVDGGGSIRIPASCNGLVGMKPTRGRLPLDADLRGMPIRIATNGIVTRSVRDTAAFYREMERTVPGRSMRPVGDVRGPGGRRLRVAVVTRSLQSDSSPEVRDETLRVATVLEGLGHHVEHLDAPPVPASFVDDFLLYWALLALAIVRAGRRLYDPSFDPRQLDDVTHGLADRAVRHLHRVPPALLRLSRCHAISRAHYETHDVLLTPTLAKAPLPIGELDPQGDFASWSERVLQWVAFTPWQNVTGEPSLSLPTGRSATGAPIGTLLSGPRGQEATLLQLGYELEESGWGRLGG